MKVKCQLTKSKDIRKQKEYWLNKMSGEIPILDLATDYKRGKKYHYKKGYCTNQLDNELVKRLKEFNTDSSNIFLAAYVTLIYKYTAQEDILLGMPIEVKENGDIFSNTLVMRMQPNGKKKFNELCTEVESLVKEALENGGYKFDELVEALSIKGGERNPLFDAAYIFEDGNYSEINRLPEVDIVLSIKEEKGAANLTLSYNSCLFSEQTIKKMLNAILMILQQIADNKNLNIDEISILSQEEKDILINKINDTYTDFPRDKSVPQLFLESAAKYGNKTALVYNNVRMTYRELDIESNKVANYLRDKYSIKRNDHVALLMEKSHYNIIAILGILKTGAAYVPIDTSFPEERIRTIVEDSKTSVIITNNEEKKISVLGEIKERSHILKSFIFLENNSEIINYDSSEIDIEKNGVKSDDIHSILYTSGSTGKPKGTLITHGNVIRVIKNTNYIEITEKDALLHLANYAFDASLFEIDGALLNGGKLVIADKETALDVIKLGGLINKENVTVSFVTTALFNTIVDTNLKCFNNLRKILFGGERISISHAVRALNYLGKNRLVHVYGPTECTVFSTYYNINEISEDSETVPIGKPLANAQVYIVKNNKLQPIGIPGELCISGDGMVKGYLNNEKLTKERFIENPFKPGERMYRTGDVVRMLPSGDIEFLDRIDQQIKMRGFRIELTEIEGALIKHDSISKAVVLDRKDESGNMYLCAYVVADEKLEVQGLEEYLSKNLPKYMIPGRYIFLDEMPLNTNGKVDKKLLLAMKAERIKKADFEEAKDFVEKKVVDICKDILKVNEISVNDRFFDIGGQSLKAAVLCNNIRSEFNITIPLADLFENPSIKEIAEEIKAIQKDTDAYNFNEELVLLKRGTDKDKNIFFVHTASNTVDCYAKLSKNMNEEFNCWGLKMKAKTYKELMNLTVEKLADDYIKIIKKVQPRGLYCLAGWCIAGDIAYEIARQLESQDNEVGFLGLINSSTNKEDDVSELWYLEEEEGAMARGLLKGTSLEGKCFENNKNECIWESLALELEKISDDEKEVIFDNICIYDPTIKYLITDYKDISSEEVVYTFNVIRMLAQSVYLKYQLEGTTGCFDINYYCAKNDRNRHLEDWAKHTERELKVHEIDCGHFDIFDGEDGKILGSKFDKELMSNR